MNQSWLNRSEYPFQPNYFNTWGLQLHYIDEGKGETFLFVHGTPSWSFDFRKIIAGLREQCRCVAIDHIGFGLSDKPQKYDYSTQNHAKTLEQFILDQDLRDINLVMHDFGGPIGMHFAVNHPDRIRRLIFMNTWFWDSSSDPDYIRFSKILRSPLLPLLYRYLNFSPRFILPASFGARKLDSAIRKNYTGPFRNPGERNGALAFAHSLLHDQAWFGGIWDKRRVLSSKPALVIWGMRDKVLKPQYLKKIEEAFPEIKTIKLEDCGHFPQEEEPEAVLDGIRRFLSEQ